MKRFLSLLLTLLLPLQAAGCTASNEQYYQQAQRFLGANEYESAARLFDQLGGYRDSTEYALYAAALHALQQGEQDLARRSLLQVDPFLNSSRYLTYLQAQQLAEADDLEGAIQLYRSLGAFADSAAQSAALTAAVPARDLRRAQALMDADGHQQALELLEGYAGTPEADEMITACRNALMQKAYDTAAELYRQGVYDEALAAFEALGDTLDARARALSCRSALYAQAEADYAAVTLTDAPELMQRYADMDGYLQSSQRLETLEARFGTALRLMERARSMPYVLYGRYPQSESGEESPVLWRVIGVSGNVATLLSHYVLDAMPLASATDLPMGVDTALPDLEQLAQMEDLSCAATPYAVNQGAEHHSDGRAWWWLADEASPGRNAIVWYNGSVLQQGVDVNEHSVGVRPVLYLDLADCSLTEGSGTFSDPFR